MARKRQTKKPTFDPKVIEQMYDDEREDEELRHDLETLCREVAGLDDAGLDVFAKSAIARARRLRRRLGN